MIVATLKEGFKNLARLAAKSLRETADALDRAETPADVSRAASAAYELAHKLLGFSCDWMNAERRSAA